MFCKMICHMHRLSLLMRTIRADATQSNRKPFKEKPNTLHNNTGGEI
jgi:hypothetical protein